MGNHNMANCCNGKIAAGQVLLSSAIDSKVGLDLCREIEKMYRRGIKCIRIGVNSPGGNVRIAYGVYKFLRSLPLEIETCNLLKVDSAAVLIYLSGQRRYVARAASFSFHRISKLMNEPLTADGFRAVAKEIEREERMVTSLLANNTLNDVQDWRARMAQGVTLGAKESISCGLSHLIGDFERSHTNKLTSSVV